MRVTPDEVRDITDDSLEDSALERHIQAATIKVNDIAEIDTSLSSSRLELIELYLAAHVATTQNPQITSETVGSGSWDYVVTEYLEMAADLDPTGTLDPDGNEPADIYVPDGR